MSTESFGYFVKEYISVQNVDCTQNDVLPLVELNSFIPFVPLVYYGISSALNKQFLRKDHYGPV